MSNLRNSVRLVGFLGSDPEIKKLTGDRKMARVSLATNDFHKNDKGEKIEDTQWHNLVMWDKTAVLAESYLHKGSEIGIEGKLSTRVYTDKAGVKRFYTEILVNEVMFIGAKKDK